MDAVEKQPIPWQKRKELGLVNALWQTIKQVLFKPGDFFDNLEVKDSYSEPLYFWLIISMPMQIIISIIYNFKAKTQTLLTLLFTPLLIFIIAGILHLPVLLFRGKGRFKGTFNVLAYTSATSIFYIIPFFIGILVTTIWSLVVGTIGYKRIHKFSTIKAVFAYIFIPLITFFLVLLAAIAIPNLLRARIMASESAAQATIRMISTAIETYAAANNGQYPSDEYALKYSIPPYLDRIYNNETISGYVYSSDLNPSGYKITATPSKCGTTGNKIFMIETNGKLSENSCK